jgi:hypothetical protein
VAKTKPATAERTCTRASFCIGPGTGTATGGECGSSCGGAAGGGDGGRRGIQRRVEAVKQAYACGGRVD